MDEVLSQNEIDALLSAISSGEMDADELKKEEEEKKVRVYDFKRALRFSKDQIRSISRIHENYARMLTTFFATQLRSFVNISVTSVDQVPYEEFIRSIPKKTILNLYSMEPLDGNLIMEINPNIAYALLDRLLGGKGSTITKDGNLTEIEKTLLMQMFEKAEDALKDAWSSVVDIEPVLEEFEENPQFMQKIAPNETVVVVSLTTIIGETTGMINMCIPHVILEPIIPKLSVHYWMQSKSNKDEQAYGKMQQNLKKTEVELKAILGATTISIHDFLHFQQGDIISLDQPIDAPLLLSIYDQPKFFAQPGKFKNKMSVQILEEIKGVNEDDE
ncbi:MULTISPECIES: flagellar motor switch protein FliM [Oceanobacillus]|uniref:Flagellar motor switch protein FliM n=1 Tax=Oceanobacillus kimchii TaxID=746691 RepID=A0ABQ5TKB0_9BACI|nr:MULTISPECIES: flagellar motor switch protein FliM [Oceanobacillus]MBT2598700.1 flagellar motor switch protein FliM [Oceanobacillus sp. ISL-74]MBT2651619.1 flagellar motor switch protein FliM [Oceanobacillus sp. ISL-73]MCT1576268.1 flagellar motor switch protein FliM [Oceanobacillus kimchii]MCT2135905.1 flagellar motor switch protein FliM [Oceanobacillus kimchii]OEH54671.1 flagellar motor switch protein FliM [Oceanobacillus sp. E9]